jgi:hypothetical protein
MWIMQSYMNLAEKEEGKFFLLGVGKSKFRFC